MIKIFTDFQRIQASVTDNNGEKNIVSKIKDEDSLNIVHQGPKR